MLETEGPMSDLATQMIRRILPTVFCLLSLTRPAAAASAYTVEEFGELDRGILSSFAASTVQAK